MPYPQFDRSKLSLLPLSDRENDLSMDTILALTDEIPTFENKNLEILADRIVEAHQHGSAVMILMGAHVIRSGVSRFLIDLMERGVIDLIGCNGAVTIHDMEFAMIGETTESVAKYIQIGQFGLWEETGRVNDAAILAGEHGLGLGESIGKMICENPHEFPNNAILLFRRDVSQFHDRIAHTGGLLLADPVQQRVGARRIQRRDQNRGLTESMMPMVGA